MKAGLIIAVLAMIMAVGMSTHLRRFNENHEFLNLNSLNPLQIAGLMSGDWMSILPASIQPIARSLFQKEQQSGVSGFLSKAQGFLGGSGGGSNGLLGGFGNLFGQASQSGQSGLSGLLNNFGSAGLSSSSLGLPAGLNLPGFSQGSNSGSSGIGGLINGITGGAQNGLSGITNGLSGLVNGASSGLNGAASGVGSLFH